MLFVGRRLPETKERRMSGSSPFAHFSFRPSALNLSLLRRTSEWGEGGADGPAMSLPPRRKKLQEFGNKRLP